MSELLNQLIMGANFNYDILHPYNTGKLPLPKNLQKRSRVKQYLINNTPMFISEIATYLDLGKTQTYFYLSQNKCKHRIVYRDFLNNGSVIDTVCSGWVDHV